MLKLAISNQILLQLGRLEKVKDVKMETLEKQMIDLNRTQMKLRATVETLAECSKNGREMDLINATNKGRETLDVAHKICGTLCPHEDEIISFVPPDPTVLKTLASVSYVGGSGFAPNSLAEGDGLKRAILGKDAKFIVVVKDQLQEQRASGGDPLRVLFKGADTRPIRYSIFDGQNGTYKVSWKPNTEGEYSLSVMLKDCHIQGSPFKVSDGTSIDSNRKPARETLTRKYAVTSSFARKKF